MTFFHRKDAKGAKDFNMRAWRSWRLGGLDPNVAKRPLVDWLPLILCLIVALGMLVVRGTVVSERAYVSFQAARDFQSFPDAPLYLGLLAVASKVGLSIPAVGMLLSVAGWLVAIVAVYVIGLRLNRPVMAAFAAGALVLEPALPPLVGQGALFVMGWLWGALANFRFEIPNFRFRASRSNLQSLIPLLALVVLGISTVYHASRSPASTLWTSYGVALLPGLALLAGFALDEFCYLVNRLPLANADRRKLTLVVAGIALLAFTLLRQSNPGIARGYAQSLIPNPQSQALWEQAGLWLQENTPPQSTVWSDMLGANGVLGYSSGRRIVAVASPDTPPDYAVAVNSLAWIERTGQPWFQEHYRRVTAINNPYDSLAPLTIYRYWPGPFDIGPVVNAGARFGEIIELVSYRLDSTLLIPGEAQHLTLSWRALEPLTRTFHVRVRLYDATNHIWAQVDNAAPAGIKTRLWPVGQLLTDRYTLEIPGDLPDGAYHVEVQVLYAENEVLTGSNLDHPLDDALRVGVAQLEAQPWTSPQPLAAAWPVTATFGSAIELTGYSVQPAPVLSGASGTLALAERGRALRVRLYWRALAVPDRSYHVFTHLMAADGHLAAQSDSVPVYETLPTNEWQVGEYVLDEHLIPIDPALPPGRYWLQVGLYALDSGERLTVRDQAGQELSGGSLPLIQVDVQ